MNLAIGRDETKSYVGYAQLLKTLCLESAAATQRMRSNFLDAPTTVGFPVKLESRLR